jgi:hypothetical protein
MDIHGNAAAVIVHSNTAIRVNGHRDPIADPCQGFVNGVIDNFIHQMMQGFLVGAAHIHTRAAANRLQAFQNLNILGSIRTRVCNRFRHYFLRMKN